MKYYFIEAIGSNFRTAFKMLPGQGAETAFFGAVPNKFFPSSVLAVPETSFYELIYRFDAMTAQIVKGPGINATPEAIEQYNEYLKLNPK